MRGRKEGFKLREIKLKLWDLLKINYALEAILNSHSNEKIDALFQFRVLGILKELERHVSNYNLIRNEKIKEYGKPGENGDIAIPPEDRETIEKFNQELVPILDSEVEVSLEPLKPEDVFSRNLEAKTLIALYPLIEGS